MVDLDAIQQHLLNIMLRGTQNEALKLTSSTLDQGVTPRDYFEKCISPSLAEVGNLFATLEIFLPELVAAADMARIITDDIIKPRIEASSALKLISEGRVLLATVQGDLHDIGKNMVGLMLKVNGFEVIDLGTNVAPSEIVLRAETEKVDIIGLSSLLTTCLPYMKDVLEYLNAKDSRDKYAVIIGGAATTPEFATKLATDGIGNSAAEAVTLCQMLIKNR
jgi:methylmalonyl-CoA mutase cobalamin-binding domain/chain